MFDIYRVAAVSPDLHPADPFFNAEAMAAAYREAVKNGAGIVLFPALAITGRSCGALFDQVMLLRAAAEAAEKFAGQTGAAPAVFGMPVLRGGARLECAAVAVNGGIAAYVVRTAPDLPGFSGEVPCSPEFFPAGTAFDGGLIYSVNFAGDPLSEDAPGVQLKLFCGAEPEIPGAWARRRIFHQALSGETPCATAGAYAGCGESTSDTVCGGALLIGELGGILAERPSPAAAPGIIYADIDREKIVAAQLRRRTPPPEAAAMPPVPQAPDLRHLVNPASPFLPEDPAERARFCQESLDLQCIGLYERFRRCGAAKMLLGISGGLDSTLALTVMALTCRRYLLPPGTMLTVTMPGFGTTGRTKNNALKLAQIVGAQIREVPIGEACLGHFRDIGHDPAVRNSVYENAQARERTQILMDIANEVNGIVIGTGDLSEIALGWATFNGDQMAMYGVNASIPKSVIPALLEYAAPLLPGSEAILRDVIATPVSPELLPPDAAGDTTQKTEEILGAYEVHDYFIHHFVSGVSDPEKLLALAADAFDGKYPEAELRRVRDLFLKRFFTQQFKRTAGPDGVQAGVISLSGRTGWQMGADLDGMLWRKGR